MKQFFLHLTRGIKNIYESVQAGITSSLLSIELGYGRTQISNVIVTFVSFKFGLLLGKYKISDTTKTVFRLSAYIAATLI
jgi:hypothetical protein